MGKCSSKEKKGRKLVSSKGNKGAHASASSSPSSSPRAPQATARQFSTPAQTTPSHSLEVTQAVPTASPAMLGEAKKSSTKHDPMSSKAEDPSEETTSQSLEEPELIFAENIQTVTSASDPAGLRQRHRATKKEANQQYFPADVRKESFHDAIDDLPDFPVLDSSFDENEFRTPMGRFSTDSSYSSDKSSSFSERDRTVTSQYGFSPKAKETTGTKQAEAPKQKLDFLESSKEKKPGDGQLAEDKNDKGTFEVIPLSAAKNQDINLQTMVEQVGAVLPIHKREEQFAASRMPHSHVLVQAKPQPTEAAKICSLAHNFHLQQEHAGEILKDTDAVSPSESFEQIEASDAYFSEDDMQPHKPDSSYVIITNERKEDPTRDCSSGYPDVIMIEKPEGSVDYQSISQPSGENVSKRSQPGHYYPESIINSLKNDNMNDTLEKSTPIAEMPAEKMVREQCEMPEAWKQMVPAEEAEAKKTLLKNFEQPGIEPEESGCVFDNTDKDGIVGSVMEEVRVPETDKDKIAQEQFEMPEVQKQAILAQEFEVMGKPKSLAREDQARIEEEAPAEKNLLETPCEPQHNADNKNCSLKHEELPIDSSRKATPEGELSPELEPSIAPKKYEIPEDLTQVAQAQQDQGKETSFEPSAKSDPAHVEGHCAVTELAENEVPEIPSESRRATPEEECNPKSEGLDKSLKRTEDPKYSEPLFSSHDKINKNDISVDFTPVAKTAAEDMPQERYKMPEAAEQVVPGKETEAKTIHSNDFEQPSIEPEMSQPVVDDQHKDGIFSSLMKVAPVLEREREDTTPEESPAEKGRLETSCEPQSAANEEDCSPQPGDLAIDSSKKPQNATLGGELSTENENLQETSTKPKELEPFINSKDKADVVNSSIKVLPVTQREVAEPTTKQCEMPETSKQVAQAQQAQGKDTLSETSTKEDLALVEEPCVTNKLAEKEVTKSPRESQYAAPEEKGSPKSENLEKPCPKREDPKDPEPTLSSHENDNMNDSSADLIPLAETAIEEIPRDKCEMPEPSEEVVPSEEAVTKKIHYNDSEEPIIKPDKTDTVSDDKSKECIFVSSMKAALVSEREGEDTAAQQLEMPEALKQVVVAWEEQVKETDKSLVRENLPSIHEEAPAERLMLETPCEPQDAANKQECSPKPGDLAVNSSNKPQDAIWEAKLRPECDYLKEAGNKPKELKPFIDSKDKPNTVDTSMKVTPVPETVVEERDLEKGKMPGDSNQVAPAQQAECKKTSSKPSTKRDPAHVEETCTTNILAESKVPESPSESQNPALKEECSSKSEDLEKSNDITEDSKDAEQFFSSHKNDHINNTSAGPIPEAETAVAKMSREQREMPTAAKWSVQGEEAEATKIPSSDFEKPSNEPEESEPVLDNQHKDSIFGSLIDVVPVPEREEKDTATDQLEMPEGLKQAVLAQEDQVKEAPKSLAREHLAQIEDEAPPERGLLETPCKPQDAAEKEYYTPKPGDLPINSSKKPQDATPEGELSLELGNLQEDSNKPKEQEPFENSEGKADIADTSKKVIQVPEREKENITPDQCEMPEASKQVEQAHQAEPKETSSEPSTKGDPTHVEQPCAVNKQAEKVVTESESEQCEMREPSEQVVAGEEAEDKRIPSDDSEQISIRPEKSDTSSNNKDKDGILGLLTERKRENTAPERFEMPEAFKQAAVDQEDKVQKTPKSLAEENLAHIAEEAPADKLVLETPCQPQDFANKEDCSHKNEDLADSAKKPQDATPEEEPGPEPDDLEEASTELKELEPFIDSKDKAAMSDTLQKFVSVSEMELEEIAPEQCEMPEASQQVAQAQQAESKETSPEPSNKKEPGHMEEPCAVNDEVPESPSESQHAALEKECSAKAEDLVKPSPKREDPKDPEPALGSHDDNMNDSSIDLIPLAETAAEEMPQEKCELQEPLEQVVPCEEAEVKIPSNYSEQSSIRPDEKDTVSDDKDKDGILGRLMEVVSIPEREGEDTAPQQFAMPEASKQVVLAQEDQVEKTPTLVARENLLHIQQAAPPEGLILETPCEPCVAVDKEECIPNPADLAIDSSKNPQDAIWEGELRPEHDYLKEAGTKPKELKPFIDDRDKAETVDTSMKVIQVPETMLEEIAPEQCEMLGDSKQVAQAQQDESKETSSEASTKVSTAHVEEAFATNILDESKVPETPIESQYPAPEEECSPKSEGLEKPSKKPEDTEDPELIFSSHKNDHINDTLVNLIPVAETAVEKMPLEQCEMPAAAEAIPREEAESSKIPSDDFKQPSIKPEESDPVLDDQHKHGIFDSSTDVVPVPEREEENTASPEQLEMPEAFQQAVIAQEDQVNKTHKSLARIEKDAPAERELLETPGELQDAADKEDYSPESGALEIDSSSKPQVSTPERELSLELDNLQEDSNKPKEQELFIDSKDEADMCDTSKKVIPVPQIEKEEPTPDQCEMHKALKQLAQAHQAEQKETLPEPLTKGDPAYMERPCAVNKLAEKEVTESRSDQCERRESSEQAVAGEEADDKRIPSSNSEQISIRPEKSDTGLDNKEKDGCFDILTESETKNTAPEQFEMPEAFNQAAVGREDKVKETPESLTRENLAQMEEEAPAEKLMLETPCQPKDSADNKDCSPKTEDLATDSLKKPQDATPEEKQSPEPDKWEEASTKLTGLAPSIDSKDKPAMSNTLQKLISVPEMEVEKIAPEQCEMPEASQQVAQAQLAEGKKTSPEPCAVNDEVPESPSESQHVGPEEDCSAKAEDLVKPSPNTEDLKDPQAPLGSHDDNMNDSSTDLIIQAGTAVEEMPQEKCEIQEPSEHVVPCEEAEVKIPSNDSEKPRIKPEEIDTVPDDKDKDGILGSLMEVVPVPEREGEDTAPQQFVMREALKQVALPQEEQVQQSPTSLARENLPHIQEEAPPERLMLETPCGPRVAAGKDECIPNPADLAVDSSKDLQDTIRKEELRPESDYLEDADTKPKELEPFIDSGDKADTVDTSMKGIPVPETVLEEIAPEQCEMPGDSKQVAQAQQAESKETSSEPSTKGNPAHVEEICATNIFAESKVPETLIESQYPAPEEECSPKAEGLEKPSKKTEDPKDPEPVFSSHKNEHINDTLVYLIPAAETAIEKMPLEQCDMSAAVEAVVLGEEADVTKIPSDNLEHPCIEPDQSDPLLNDQHKDGIFGSSTDVVPVPEREEEETASKQLEVPEAFKQEVLAQEDQVNETPKSLAREHLLLSEKEAPSEGELLEASCEPQDAADKENYSLEPGDLAIDSSKKPQDATPEGELSLKLYNLHEASKKPNEQEPFSDTKCKEDTVDTSMRAIPIPDKEKEEMMPEQCEMFEASKEAAQAQQAEGNETSFEPLTREVPAYVERPCAVNKLAEKEVTGRQSEQCEMGEPMEQVVVNKESEDKKTPSNDSEQPNIEPDKSDTGLDQGKDDISFILMEVPVPAEREKEDTAPEQFKMPEALKQVVLAQEDQVTETVESFATENPPHIEEKAPPERLMLEIPCEPQDSANKDDFSPKPADLATDSSKMQEDVTPKEKLSPKPDDLEKANTKLKELEPFIDGKDKAAIRDTLGELIPVREMELEEIALEQCEMPETSKQAVQAKQAEGREREKLPEPSTEKGPAQLEEPCAVNDLAEKELPENPSESQHTTSEEECSSEAQDLVKARAKAEHAKDPEPVLSSNMNDSSVDFIPLGKNSVEEMSREKCEMQETSEQVVPGEEAEAKKISSRDYEQPSINPEASDTVSEDTDKDGIFGSLMEVVLVPEREEEDTIPEQFEVPEAFKQAKIAQEDKVEKTLEPLAGENLLHIQEEAPAERLKLEIPCEPQDDTNKEEYSPKFGNLAIDSSEKPPDVNAKEEISSEPDHLEEASTKPKELEPFIDSKDKADTGDTLMKLIPVPEMEVEEIAPELCEMPEASKQVAQAQQFAGRETLCEPSTKGDPAQVEEHCAVDEHAAKEVPENPSESQHAAPEEECSPKSKDLIKSSQKVGDIKDSEPILSRHQNDNMKGTTVDLIPVAETAGKESPQQQVEMGELLEQVFPGEEAEARKITSDGSEQHSIEPHEFDMVSDNENREGVFCNLMEVGSIPEREEGGTIPEQFEMPKVLKQAILPQENHQLKETTNSLARENLPHIEEVAPAEKIMLETPCEPQEVGDKEGSPKPGDRAIDSLKKPHDATFEMELSPEPDDAEEVNIKLEELEPLTESKDKADNINTSMKVIPVLETEVEEIAPEYCEMSEASKQAAQGQRSEGDETSSEPLTQGAPANMEEPYAVNQLAEKEAPESSIKPQHASPEEECSPKFEDLEKFSLESEDPKDPQPVLSSHKNEHMNDTSVDMVPMAETTVEEMPREQYAMPEASEQVVTHEEPEAKKIPFDKYEHPSVRPEERDTVAVPEREEEETAQEQFEIPEALQQVLIAQEDQVKETPKTEAERTPAHIKEQAPAERKLLETSYEPQDAAYKDDCSTKPGDLAIDSSRPLQDATPKGELSPQPDDLEEVIGTKPKECEPFLGSKGEGETVNTSIRMLAVPGTDVEEIGPEHCKTADAIKVAQAQQAEGKETSSEPSTKRDPAHIEDPCAINEQLKKEVTGSPSEEECRPKSELLEKPSTKTEDPHDPKPVLSSQENQSMNDTSLDIIPVAETAVKEMLQEQCEMPDALDVVAGEKAEAKRKPPKDLGQPCIELESFIDSKDQETIKKMISVPETAVEEIAPEQCEMAEASKQVAQAQQAEGEETLCEPSTKEDQAHVEEPRAENYIAEKKLPESPSESQHGASEEKCGPTSEDLQKPSTKTDSKASEHINGYSNDSMNDTSVDLIPAADTGVEEMPRGQMPEVLKRVVAGEETEAKKMPAALIDVISVSPRQAQEKTTTSSIVEAPVHIKEPMQQEKLADEKAQDIPREPGVTISEGRSRAKPLDMHMEKPEREPEEVETPVDSKELKLYQASEGVVRNQELKKEERESLEPLGDPQHEPYAQVNQAIRAFPGEDPEHIDQFCEEEEQNEKEAQETSSKTTQAAGHEGQCNSKPENMMPQTPNETQNTALVEKFTPKAERQDAPKGELEPKAEYFKQYCIKPEESDLVSDNKDSKVIVGSSMEIIPFPKMEQKEIAPQQCEIPAAITQVIIAQDDKVKVKPKDIEICSTQPREAEPCLDAKNPHDIPNASVELIQASERRVEGADQNKMLEPSMEPKVTATEGQHSTELEDLKESRIQKEFSCDETVEQCKWLEASQQVIRQPLQIEDMCAQEEPGEEELQDIIESYDSTMERISSQKNYDPEKSGTRTDEPEPPVDKIDDGRMPEGAPCSEKEEEEIAPEALTTGPSVNKEGFCVQEEMQETSTPTEPQETTTAVCPRPKPDDIDMPRIQPGEARPAIDTKDYDTITVKSLNVIPAQERETKEAGLESLNVGAPLEEQNEHELAATEAPKTSRKKQMTFPKGWASIKPQDKEKNPAEPEETESPVDSEEEFHMYEASEDMLQFWNQS